MLLRSGSRPSLGSVSALRRAALSPARGAGSSPLVGAASSPLVGAGGVRTGLRRLAVTALTPSRLALGRAGLGVALVAAPARSVALLGTDAGAARAASWTAQMLGAREVALGLGTAVALRRPDRRAARLWVAAGLLCDAVDALAVARAAGRGDVHRATGVAVTGVAVAAVTLEAAVLAGDDLR